MPVFLSLHRNMEVLCNCGCAVSKSSTFPCPTMSAEMPLSKHLTSRCSSEVVVEAASVRVRHIFNYIFPAPSKKREQASISCIHKHFLNLMKYLSHCDSNTSQGSYQKCTAYSTRLPSPAIPPGDSGV